jgi:hypothetical protein
MPAILLSPTPSAAARDAARDHDQDPAHVAYGHAAAVLASAQALEASARAPGSVPATAPALACLETSLDALAMTVERLRAHALERLAHPGLSAEPPHAGRGRLAADLARLAGTLDQAATACAQARRSLAPIAGELAET